MYIVLRQLLLFMPFFLVFASSCVEFYELAVLLVADFCVFAVVVVVWR